MSRAQKVIVATCLGIAAVFYLSDWTLWYDYGGRINYGEPKATQPESSLSQFAVAGCGPGQSLSTGASGDWVCGDVQNLNVSTVIAGNTFEGLYTTGSP